MDLYEYQGKQFFATLRHPGVSPARPSPPSTTPSPPPSGSATRWW